ncbi:MAG: DVU0298 family protein [Thermodesulfobacteriota bacterium]
MKGRALKKKILGLLQDSGLDGVLALLDEFPGRQLVNPLVGCLCSSDEMVKWLAVSALGRAVAKLADQEMEEARVVMRRFMWMLNDESGGIGWGVPEAMGEVMACHAGLAEEYAHILVANMREEGNFLELEMLQRGLMWGLGRLCGARPQLMQAKNAGLYLPFYLDSADPEVRGRAVWALGRLGDRTALAKLKARIDDQSPVTIYLEGKIQHFTIGELVAEVLAK